MGGAHGSGRCSPRGQQRPDAGAAPQRAAGLGLYRGSAAGSMKGFPGVGPDGVCQEPHASHVPCGCGPHVITVLLSTRSQASLLQKRTSGQSEHRAAKLSAGSASIGPGRSVFAVETGAGCGQAGR